MEALAFNSICFLLSALFIAACPFLLVTLANLPKMNASLYNSPKLQPKPPDKGSFPLDHTGACKAAMIQYMSCLRTNDNDNGQCRDLSKAYLKCRMDNNLMTKEDWKFLGYDDGKTTTESTKK